MAIAWDEAAPANTDNAGTGDDVLRSLKTNIAGGLSQSMYWPGTGGGSTASAGQMKPGAARTFFAAQSLVSANSDGCLMVASDTSRLFGVGSTGSTFFGGARSIEHATLPLGNTRWVVSGQTVPNGTNTALPVTFNTVPHVTLSLLTSATTYGAAVISALTAGGVTVDVYRAGGAAYASGVWSVYVLSSGTVTF